MNPIVENIKNVIYSYIYYNPITPENSNTQTEPNAPECLRNLSRDNDNDTVTAANIVQSDIDNADDNDYCPHQHVTLFRGNRPIDEEDDNTSEEYDEYSDTAFPEEEKYDDNTTITTIKMEEDDGPHPNITMFRGNRPFNEEDEEEESALYGDGPHPNITMFRGNRPFNEEDEEEESALYEDGPHPNITMFRGNRPFNEEDGGDYIDISDTIDEYTISEMRYNPGANGTIRGCIVCHYFVDCSLCLDKIIYCKSCDCIMDRVI